MKIYKESAISELLMVSDKATTYFEERLDIDDDSSGVDRNIYISIGGRREPPSVTYRKWAQSKKKSYELLNLLLDIKDRDGFSILHKIMVDDLELFWKENQNDSLNLNQSRKLVDLFFRFLARTRYAYEHGIADTIIKYAYIPLGNQTLMAVKNLFERTNRFNRMMVCKNPSMDNVEDKEDYDFLQKQIYHLTEDAGVPNLYFDIYVSVTNNKHINTD